MSVFNKIKKLLSIVLVFGMASNLMLMPVYAEDEINTQVMLKYDSTVTAEKIDVLKALGVLEYDINENMYGTAVTRAQAYGAVIGLLGDVTEPLDYQKYTYSDIKGTPEADKIEFACQLGIMEAEWNFKPESQATFGEAVKAIVCCMGYSEVAEARGSGDAGFVMVAQNSGVLNGVLASNGQVLVWEDLIAMMYNSLDVEILHLRGYTDYGEQLLAKTGDTLLSVYFDVYPVEGVVTSNERTHLFKAGDAGEGRVTVGDTAICVGSTNADDLLGYYVEGYAKKDGNTYTMLYVKPSDENRIWTIDASELLVDDNVWSAYRIVYLNDKGLTKHLNLPSDVSVIYNGKRFFEYTAEDLKILQGTITAVDYDNDSVVEVVLIDEYVNKIISSVNSTYQIITFMDGTTLDLGEALNWELLSINGHDYPLDEMEIYSVASINVSKDGSYIRGIVMKNVVSAKVTGIGEENGRTKYLLDNTQTVTVCPSFEMKNAKGEYLIQYDGRPAEIKFGVKYSFYRDKNGDIACITESDSGMIYAFAWGCAVQGALDEDVAFKLFTQDGEWQVYKASKNLSVNGTKYTQEEFINMVEQRLPTELFDINGFKKQLLKLKLNDNSDITKIYTPMTEEEAIAGGIADEALIGPVQINTLHKNGLLGARLSYNISGAAVFGVPYDKTGLDFDEKRLAVGTSSALANDQSVALDLYDLSDTLSAAVAVRYDYVDGGGSGGVWNNGLIYIKGISYVYEDDEEVYTLKCIGKGKEVTYRAANDIVEDNLQKLNLQAGDIIAAHVDSNDQIDSTKILRVFGKNDTFTNNTPDAFNTGAGSGNGSNLYIVYGTVEEKDAQAIAVNSGNESMNSIPLGAVGRVVYYDRSARNSETMFRIGSASEIKKHDKVIICIRAMDIYDVVVLENE